MLVHWGQKWLAVQYQGQTRVLHGVTSSSPRQILLQIDIAQQPAVPAKEQLQVPQFIRPLLDEYKDLFAEPTSLPPSRACDHQIPLILGAQPIFIRPYRYPPKLKDEIERQV
jgi:hypothetical protein